MGYGKQQLKDLETTINNTDCDSVIIATPIDLNRIIKIRKPNTRVYYDLQEIGNPNLSEVTDDFVKKHHKLKCLAKSLLGEVTARRTPFCSAKSPDFAVT